MKASELADAVAVEILVQGQTDGMVPAGEARARAERHRFQRTQAYLGAHHAALATLIALKDLGQVVLERATIEALLQSRWEELMNDATNPNRHHAMGMIFMAEALGLITPAEAEGWRARIERCPEAPEHGGGRVWCAYCGNLAAPPPDRIGIPGDDF